MTKKVFLAMCFCIVASTVFAGVEPRLFAKADREAMDRWVDSVFLTMSDDERIGQLFMIAAYPKADAAHTKALLENIDRIKIGGILFRQGDPVTQAQVTNHMQQVSRIPLFIALDGEWGLSMRLSGTTRFPKNMMLGAVDDEQLIEDYAREVGRQCNEMGIHINFAPVLDVNDNPDNPVIGMRSFGEKPGDVARKGIAYARGLESMDVIAVAKHFPGHGGTSEDSHHTLPTVLRSTGSLDSIELEPFRRYIDSRFAGMMSGHLYVPALDSVANRAGSLSDIMIAGLLKGRMGFEGLCFTDALEMKGAAAGDTESPTVRALLAGNDVALAPGSPEKEFEAVKKAVRDSVLKMEDIHARCRKILQYKYVAGLNRYKPVETKGLSERLNTPYAHWLAARLNAESITVLKNDREYIPLKQLDKTKIAVLTVGEPNENEFLTMLNRYCPVTAFRITAKSRESEIKNTALALESYDAIVCGIFTTRIPELPQLRELARRKNLIYVFFTSPYFGKTYQRSIESSRTLIMAYEATPYAQRFAAQIIFGGIPAKGKLAVTIPGLFRTGAGLSTPKTRLGYHFPEETGMNAACLDSIDMIVGEGLEEEAYPGCQVLIAKDGMIVYSKSFGYHDYQRKKPVTESSVYDLASVSKAAGTLLAVMKAYGDTLLTLDAPLSDCLPEMRGTDKSDLRIEELLYHQTGLPPTIGFYLKAIDKSSFEGSLYSVSKKSTHPVLFEPQTYVRNDFTFLPEIVSSTPKTHFTTQVARDFYVHDSFRDTIMNEIGQAKLSRRGKYVYSCVNFILLKMIVERRMQQPMDELLRTAFFDRLGAYYTTYNPLNRFDSTLIVPTENDRFVRRQMLHGYVHDEAAAFQGGVSGNAGLFSNANDLAKTLQLYLNEGTYGGETYLSETVCKLFTSSKSPVSRRGLGFDKPETDTTKVSPCGELAPPCVYGHTGYTGTCFWIDPENKLIYIFLSNRLHPTRLNTKLFTRNIRTRIQDVIYRSLQHGVQHDSAHEIQDSNLANKTILRANL
ncbi:MAG: serine hydrolase [Tannerella sp.]|jgi:beta-glucosidase-like glycosyl hydrolase/CubicO group peptidase (beta-lactamase class C family)|nr:serine hydrolase [Tannerella sp.]